MKLRHLISLSGLLLASSIGCCHSRCVCSDPCDPCGNVHASGGSCVSGWMCNKVDAWRMRNHGRNYGWNDMACGCDVCSTCFDGEMIGGGSSCGCGGGSVMNSVAPSSGCSCGQSHGAAMPSVPPSVTPWASPQNGSPSPIPMPPTTVEPSPAPAANDASSTSIQFSPPGQPQHVSVEEFQRLPGVIVAGPTAQSSVPTVASSATIPLPASAAPQLSADPVAPRVATGAQQVNWVPTKQ